MLGSDDSRVRYHVKLALAEYNNEFDALAFENAFNRYTDERRSQIRGLIQLQQKSHNKFQVPKPAKEGIGF